MKTITIIGWSAKSSSVVERVTFWPDEMETLLSVAKAMQVTDLMTVEKVLVESEEPSSLQGMDTITMEIHSDEAAAPSLTLHTCNVCGHELDSAGVCHWCKEK